MSRSALAPYNIPHQRFRIGDSKKEIENELKNCLCYRKEKNETHEVTIADHFEKNEPALELCEEGLTSSGSQRVSQPHNLIR